MSKVIVKTECGVEFVGKRRKVNSAFFEKIEKKNLYALGESVYRESYHTCGLVIALQNMEENTWEFFKRVYLKKHDEICKITYFNGIPEQFNVHVYKKENFKKSLDIAETLKDVLIQMKEDRSVIVEKHYYE